MTVQLFTKVVKTSDTLDVKLTAPFQSPPIVLVTPVYNQAVGFEECVIKSSNKEVSIKSQNKAADYYVNILAISSGLHESGDFHVFAGKDNKTQASATFENYLANNPSFPVTIVTSKWTDRVLYVDTINNITSSEITETSQNIAPDYYTQYLSMNRGRFILDGMEFQCGIVNKTSLGQMKIFFNSSFSNTPTVFLSSFWNTENGQVKYVETVIDTDIDSCTIDSQNSHSNYYVLWLAVAEA